MPKDTFSMRRSYCICFFLKINFTFYFFDNSNILSLVPSTELSSINNIGSFCFLTIVSNKKITLSFSFNVGIITMTFLLLK